MQIDLRGKRAFVGGASKGIGKATALVLADCGAEIILAARNEEGLQQTLSELSTQEGQKHHVFPVDFSQPEQLKKSLEEHAALFDPIHILVNNAGGPPAGPLLDANPVDLRIPFNIHVVCNQILTQTFSPTMAREGYGRIINIISTSVKEPLDHLGVSNTIRGAVGNWAKTMANELGHLGITVNNVLPGPTETERLRELTGEWATKSGKTLDEVMMAMADSTPLKRIAEPSEVANAVAFLASPAASYITGINLPVDGGRTRSL